MIWTKRPSSQFSSDSFRSDNLVGFGLGATGSGIGRLGLKRELLVPLTRLRKTRTASETDRPIFSRVSAGSFLTSRQFGRESLWVFNTYPSLNSAVRISPERSFGRRESLKWPRVFDS